MTPRAVARLPSPPLVLRRVGVPNKASSLQPSLRRKSTGPCGACSQQGQQRRTLPLYRPLCGILLAAYSRLLLRPQLTAELPN